MTAFVAVRWPEKDRDSDDRVAVFRTTLRQTGLAIAIDRPGWIVACEHALPATPPRIRKVGRRLIVGEIFCRDSTEIGTVGGARVTAAEPSMEKFCEALARDSWGSYVALDHDVADPGRLDVFRDPIGMMDCIGWHCGDVAVVTSRPELFLGILPPRNFAIDWACITRLIRCPGSAVESLPFIGLIDLPPGTLVHIAGEQAPRATALWSPTSFGRVRGSYPRGSVELPGLVDACVAAWCMASRSAVAELSGGLDSAIVASALTRASHQPVSQWLHYHARDRESDERPFARAVAEQLGVPLAEVFRDDQKLDAELVRSLPVSLRPNVGGVSLFHDRDLAERAAAAGADTLFTGQGGDALFFQMPTPLIAGELWRCGWPVGRRLRTVESLARWTERSTWSVLAYSLFARLAYKSQQAPTLAIDLTAKRKSIGRLHQRWTDDAQGIAPAKHLQIKLLASARSVMSGAWSASSMRVIHPLLSQPLIERVLEIPVLELTRGERDRAMIRSVYASRLPEMLLDRRGKGNVSAYYGRMLAASTDFLRGYLLNGMLASYGLLDLDLVNSLLNPDVIMLRNINAEIFTLLFLERWARRWSTIAAATS